MLIAVKRAIQMHVGVLSFESNMDWPLLVCLVGCLILCNRHDSGQQDRLIPVKKAKRRLAISVNYE